LSDEEKAPMATSIEQARREVQAAFERACARADTAAQQSFWDFERELWTLRLALGQALILLFLARQGGRPRPVEYRHEGRRSRLAGERSTELGTRCGKVVFTRPVGRRPDAPRTACDLPVDRELGLGAGFSLGVGLAMTRLGAPMAFAAARATCQETYEWAPSPRATLRMVDAVGDQARAFLEQAPVPEEDGEVWVIQVDGKGAPLSGAREYARRCGPRRGTERGIPARHVRRERRRAQLRPKRTKGKKSKNAKVAVVGVLYTLRRTPQGRAGPLGKRSYATFTSHAALFVWLRREADKRGYGRKPTLFLADGSDHIWRLQQQYFPEAEGCLDWDHVVEKLWSTGECLYPEGSAALVEWVGSQTERVRRGAVKSVLRTRENAWATIPQTGPGNKGQRQRLRKTIAHFPKHLPHLRYDTLRRRALDIGTGVVEGAVRHLVAMRLDGPGMRWGLGRAERVLHLRCVLLNGQWSDFAAYIASRGTLILAAQPIPTQPHTAKAAA
jgi:hypothetical protein